MSAEQLSAHFYASEDDASVALMWGWAMSVAQWLENPARDALAQLTAPRGALDREIGALALDEPLERGPIVIGARVGFTAAGLAPAAITKQRQALMKRSAKLDPALWPVDIGAPPQLYLLARGALCNAVLAFGAWHDQRPETIVGRWLAIRDQPRRYVEWHRHDKERAQGQERGGVVGVRIANAGPWRSPMVQRVDWDAVSHRGLTAAFRGQDARYHLLYQYGN